ncbi:olfactory receptor 5G3-like [Lacerta agilis]|uniref:olfactory receptor 5G3-like n=1 Tax=Lacerta agilis TaxID=80427 RepID=UPI001419BB79|nr:olfactory receptor 5G3-like [Lacerta agilis]
MSRENHSTIYEFILLGFTDSPELKILLFVFFLVVYLITIVGNLGMILLIRIDSRLHTPMYFFLSQLSFVDLCYSSVVTPKMLMDFVVKSKSISLPGCAAQMAMFCLFVATEAFILAAMAYDRYVAISKPLLYTVIMSRKICAQLMVGPYLAGLLNATTHTSLTFQLTFCKSTINHFFCDIPAVISLSCSDTSFNLMVLLGLSFTLGTLSGVIVIISYIYILAATLRIRSSEGRHKAASTCFSHLTAVSLFFGSLFFIYVRPSSGSSEDEDKTVSMFYTVLIPMLNPLIYSLRNKDVKDAVKRVLRTKHLS